MELALVEQQQQQAQYCQQRFPSSLQIKPAIRRVTQTSQQRVRKQELNSKLDRNANQSSDCVNLNLKTSSNLKEAFQKTSKSSKTKKSRNQNYPHVSPAQNMTQQNFYRQKFNNIPISQPKISKSSLEIRPETLINSLKVSQNKLYQKNNMNNWKEQIHLNFGLGSSIKRIIPQKIPNPNMMPIQSNCDIKHDI